MSMFSGKCDFGDTWEILGSRTKNIKVYFGDNIVPLRIDSRKDALPYFPFIVSSMSSSDELTVVHLSTKSYVDEREEQIIQNSWKYMQKLYRKLAKKCEPTVDDLLVDYWSKGSVDGRIMAQALVDKKGKGHLPDNLTYSYLDHYRDLLYNEMIANRYDPDEAYRWVYGFKRWLNKIRKDKAEG